MTIRRASSASAPLTAGRARRARASRPRSRLGARRLAPGPDVLAHAVGPPDAAGALVGDHARPDGLARRAGEAVQPALVRIDPAEHDLGAVAAGRHLARA